VSKFNSMFKRRGNYYFTSLFLIHLSFLLLSSCAGSKKSAGENKVVSEAIATARSYTGVPYKYGGTQRAGMDCSALTMLSYRKAGISLPRTTRDQSKIGKSVGKHELQPGDLVFFSARKGRSKITHVGLVTRVNRKEIIFIHASTKLGVVESDLNSNYYSGIFVKARRPY